MAIVGGQLDDRMWAQHFGGSHSYSRTIQVPGVGAICEIDLISHWGTDDHAASDAFITQCVSANGVEEFPKENRTGSDLVSMIYRDRVTSVTFKVSCYKAKAMAHWVIYYWQ